MSYFTDVGEFHEKFDLPVAGKTMPALLAYDIFMFRLKFLQEELNEFLLAHLENDLEKCGDALADLVYVALGTAHMMGLPFEEIWNEVQRANMLKERAKGANDNRSKRSHQLDVVKPEGWTPPSHREAIIAARAAVLQRMQQT